MHSSYYFSSDASKIHKFCPPCAFTEILAILLAELLSCGYNVAKLIKDGDINAKSVLSKIFPNCDLARCWIHGHRTIYNKIKLIPKTKETAGICKECRKACDRAKAEKKDFDVGSCSHLGGAGMKPRCGCPSSSTGASIKHIPIDAGNGIANRVQRGVSYIFTQLHPHSRLYTSEGILNPDFKETKVIRKLATIGNEPITNFF